MKHKFAYILMASIGITAIVAACGGDDDDNGSAGKGGTQSTGGTGGKGGTGGTGGTSGSSGTSGTSGSGGTGGTISEAGTDADAGNQPPALGAQIDRMGRPGVNTALTDPFDTVSGKTPNAVKDEYNASSDPTQWKTKYTSLIAGNLAILNGLDGDCTNQTLQSPTAVDAGAVGAYGTLAGALADDQLYVNTAKPEAGVVTCSQYLAVELNATALLSNTDCGGRRLEYDVIDTTYTALVAEPITGPTVTDGVANDSTFDTAFPFLGAPNPD